MIRGNFVISQVFRKKKKKSCLAVENLCLRTHPLLWFYYLKQVRMGKIQFSMITSSTFCKTNCIVKPELFQSLMQEQSQEDSLWNYLVCLGFGFFNWEWQLIPTIIMLFSWNMDPGRNFSGQSDTFLFSLGKFRQVGVFKIRKRTLRQGRNAC